MPRFPLTGALLRLIVLVLGSALTVATTGVPGLPSAEDIESLTLQYQASLTRAYSEERFFPALRFPFNGRIIGWKFAATNNQGGGRPLLKTWSLIEGDSYVRNSCVALSECVTSQVQLDSFTAFIHESGPPSPGINFTNGSILSIFMRPMDIADFVPYLYDGRLQSDVTARDDSFSFYRVVRTPRDDDVTISQLTEHDHLLPLISLELCSLESTPIAGIMPCDGTTLLKNSLECRASTPATNTATLTTQTPTTITTSSGAATTGTTAPATTGTTAAAAPALATATLNTILLIAIIVPAVFGLLVMVVLCIMIFICCLFYRKRKHSTYTTDIALEPFHNGSSSASSVIARSYKPPPSVEYDSVDPAFVVSITGENGVHKAEAVGNYEEPKTLFSSSAGSSVFEDGRHRMYDTPLHSREPSTIEQGTPSFYSPVITNSPLPPLPLEDYRKYHTLERPECNTPPLLRRASPQNSPGESPHQPRLRLRASNHHLTFRRVGSAPLNENRESPQPDGFFRLETGAYVPTEDQRNSIAIKNIFDDTSYATFNRTTANSPPANNWVFFEECESYWKPAGDSSKLYDQLAHQKYREINRKQLEINDPLGSGEFGTVYNGEWHTEQGDLDIAVKMLSKEASERDKIRFLQEAAIMGQFKHPNIVRLYGVVTVGEPVMIVLELVKNGDLRQFLRSLKPVPGEAVPADLSKRLLNFCSQIALGMEYLSRKEFVHRDLAARNILLTEDYICKIADFGMSRDLDDNDYYISNGGKVPIKWTAPEALHYRKYSTASDVWSFGVLMFEVWSMGKTPFRELSPEQTISLVQSGCRLAPPPGCPMAIYQIMMDCWHPEADQRPSFAKLITALSQPSATLLYWSPEDSIIHPMVNRLGAPLEASAELYSHLQKSYMYASADLAD